MTEHKVENEYGVEEIYFYELTITGGDSDYDTLEGGNETISLNDMVWIKVNKAIRKVKVMKIIFSDRKEDSKYLKANRIDTSKEEKVLIKNVSL